MRCLLIIATLSEAYKRCMEKATFIKIDMLVEKLQIGSDD